MSIPLLWRLAASALLLLSMSGIASAQQAVPFDTYATLTDPAGDPVDPAWQAYCEAQGYDLGFQGTRTGTATHLGKYISPERGCLDFSSFPIVQSRNIEILFVAANGDELMAISEGDFDFSQNPPRLLWAFFEFTGGTGRFENATGGGEVIDSEEAPVVLFRYLGEISYTASDRRRR